MTTLNMMASVQASHDLTPVWVAIVTGTFGIISTILTHKLTKSSVQKKAEMEREKASVLAATSFGRSAFQQLNRIQQALIKIDKIGDNIFTTTALRKLDQSAERLFEMSAGKLRVEEPTELTNVPSELSRRMKSLSASSLWSGDPAREACRKKFLELQAYAIQERQVPIRRLFIVEDITLEKSRNLFAERMASDRKQGVAVRWMRKLDWTASETVKDPVDFGIWDNELVWLYEPHPKEENRLWRASLLRSEAEARLYAEVFEANWQLAASPDNLIASK